MYYREILEGLYRNRIRHLIVGGLAVNLHGVPRVTQDIDLVIASDRENIVKLCTYLKSARYVPLHPIDPAGMADPATIDDWITNRSMKAFSFYHSERNYQVVDIVIDHGLDFAEAFERRKTVKIDDIEVYIASIDDLIAMKKKSGRPKDLSDVEMLAMAKKILEGDDEG